jgi:hypothetical protein
MLAMTSKALVRKDVVPQTVCTFLPRIRTAKTVASRARTWSVKGYPKHRYGSGGSSEVRTLDDINDFRRSAHSPGAGEHHFFISSSGLSFGGGFCCEDMLLPYY